ncbi:MAG TPA: RNA pseudouridine synthase [Deltaproteobacteria bacterium]|nr:MAG: hypothetical protein A2Z79_03225 [Deltaproteobacteria bacterium GWA2_55_82]OGQ62294.1 MAG: hypothetical protein A3I81_05135 [Deltaproteobacteria bacterium RIFCSPLOWO2_02_FULL_55_12]OIJ74406.1 MAG: hypothetical protein A2V21_309125 [Deltaproteobacteria bacterium GWC2_55_46]HBG47056.1 RNA pseudouridine synthase [Deltaproteobacteria bacterium]HCY10885.1 RNA pseudouridine synthase [Deltaproteobacteria bacterium]
MEKVHTFTVTAEESSERLDIFLSGRLPELTRSRIKALTQEGRAAVNGRSAKAGQKVRENDTVSVSLPEISAPLPDPEDIPLDILYEDDDIIVVNKEAQIAVHPGAGRSSGTLVNALLFRTRLASIGGPWRPGIVHRLDKDTTGALVIAKNDQSYLKLTRQFKERTSSRKYIALVWGSMKDDAGTIDMPIGRDSVHRKRISTRARIKRSAITNYRVLGRFPLMTLLELKLETGRTHQIRVHLSEIKHPVVGDQVYGKRAVPPALDKKAADILKGIGRQMLHAYMLGITHPRTGDSMEFTAPMPPDMEKLVEALREGSAQK